MNEKKISGVNFISILIAAFVPVDLIMLIFLVQSIERRAYK